MKKLFVVTILLFVPVVATFGQAELEKYIGQYQIPSAALMVTVTAESGKLSLQVTGQGKNELEYVSAESYVIKGAPINIIFKLDAAGTVTGMVIQQSGQDVLATKINSSTEAPSDKSPHKSEFVTANGIKMNYLDWGGSGDVIILLSGFGNDAHVFDDFAPSFTDKFHVIALTRRGFGGTDRPASGYDTATRVEDIRAFMDALTIQRATLIGHSLAGDEMTMFAMLYPKRVIKMVYLDAAYDRRKLLTCEMPSEIAPPEAMRLLGEAMNCPGWEKIVVKDLGPPDVYKMEVETMRSAAQFRPDYTKITVPSLAIYADPDVAQLPDNLLPDTRKRLETYWKESRTPLLRASIEQFRKEMKNGQRVEIKGATHYVFVGPYKDQTIKLTHDFLTK
jgi:pimeloyl-ACP methyl ester carboxylesterase